MSTGVGNISGGGASSPHALVAVKEVDARPLG